MPDDRPDEFLATQAIADFSVRAGALGRKKTGWTISKSSRKFTSDDGLEQIDQGMEDQGIPACAESVPFEPRRGDWRDFSLRFVPESLEVHRVTGMELRRTDLSLGEIVRKHNCRWLALGFSSPGLMQQRSL